MIRPYYSESLEREASPSPEQFTAEETIIDLLSSPELDQEIHDGNVTVAMIRPSLTGCTANDEWSDQEAANTIEEHIMKLGVITKFSVNFDVDTVHEFYGGQPKEVQLGLQPERYPEYETRWHEFVDLMCSGPTTVILLHSTNGDAIRLWRDQVGHYDIVKRRDPSTIRGTFGKDNYNNLIHGSDSIEAVKKEIAIISKLLGRF